MNLSKLIKRIVNLLFRKAQTILIFFQKYFKMPSFAEYVRQKQSLRTFQQRQLPPERSPDYNHNTNPSTQTTTTAIRNQSFADYCRQRQLTVGNREDITVASTRNVPPPNGDVRMNESRELQETRQATKGGNNDGKGKMSFREYARQKNAAIHIGLGKR